MQRTVCFSLCVFLLMSSASATNWQVQVGFGIQSQALFAAEWATLAFFPQNITINVGDTITWVMMNDAHTVTFAPSVLPIFTDPTTLQLNPYAIGVPGVGTELNPVIINSTTATYSSGIIATPGEGPYATNWTATFTAQGTYFYFCIIHFNMLGYVTVQPANTPYPMNQSEVNQTIVAEQQTLLNELATLDARIKQYPTGQLFSNGSAFINVDDGYGDVDLHFSVNIFGPSYFEANVGDTINFVLGDTAVGHTLALNGSNLFDWPSTIFTIDFATTPPTFFAPTDYFLKTGSADPWVGQFVSGGFLSQGYASNQGTYQSFQVVIGDLAANGFTLPQNFTFLCNLHSVQVCSAGFLCPAQEIVGMVGQVQISAAGSPRPWYYSNSTYFVQPTSPGPPPSHSPAAHVTILSVSLLMALVLALLRFVA